MVLKLENIKKKLNSFIFFLILILVLYLLANFIYLIWYVANPEGFWGFSYFWELLMVAVFAIILIFFVSLLFTIVVSTFYKIIIGKSNFKELFKLFKSLCLYKIDKIIIEITERTFHKKE